MIVDETPTSPNQKEQAWGAIVQMMPFLSRMPPMPPSVILELLKYSPLPECISPRHHQGCDEYAASPEPGSYQGPG